MSETLGPHVPSEGPENRTNASLERENTALGLESDELKAQQVTMEAHQVTLERLIDINRALLDASVDGIRLSDLEGRTLLANSVVRELRTEVFDVQPDVSADEQDRKSVV